jgi:hypothetical protein
MRPAERRNARRSSGERFEIAKAGQDASWHQHSPIDVAALSLRLHATVTAARRLASRIAHATDAPAFGLVDAADALDAAADHLAVAVTDGGKHGID